MKKVLILLLFLLTGVGIYLGGSYLHWDFSSLAEQFISKRPDDHSGKESKTQSSSDSQFGGGQDKDRLIDNGRIDGKNESGKSAIGKVENGKAAGKDGQDLPGSSRSDLDKTASDKSLAGKNDLSIGKAGGNEEDLLKKDVAETKKSGSISVSIPKGGEDQNKSGLTSEAGKKPLSGASDVNSKFPERGVIGEESSKGQDHSTEGGNKDGANSETITELRQSEEDLRLFENFYGSKTVQKNFSEDFRIVSEEYQEKIELIRQAPSEIEAKKIGQQMRKAMSDKKLEILETCLAGLESRSENLKKIQKELPDSILEKLAPLVQEAKDLAEMDVPELKSRRCEFVLRLEAFQKELERKRPQYIALKTYDALGGSSQDLIDFLKFFRKSFPDSEYSRDFESVSSYEAAMAALEFWNGFILKNGAKLDHFAIDYETAADALAFCREFDLKKFSISERLILKSREEEFQAIHDVKVCQKITETLQFAGKTGYWICRRAPEQWLYLTAPPRLGANLCQVDLFGAERTVILTEKEVANVQEARQTVLFRQLEKKAAAVDDRLRITDPGRWYSEWASIVVQIKNDELIDPIVKILYLKDICIILAAGDYFFNQQLTSWIKVMNTSPFNSNVNWFDFDDAQIGKNRLNAKALLNFIDSGDLETVMSTAELNASVEPLGFVYHQVGWLDRDLTGKVFCRGQDLAKSDLPNGQLFIIEKADVPILVPVSKGASPENESVNELSGQKQFGFSLRKIGAIFDKQVALDSLPESVVRGIPVFLRFSVTASGSFAFAVENAKGLSEKSQESTK